MFRSLVGSGIGARIRIRPVSTLDMSSGAFRDEHQSQAVARTPTPFPCKSIGAEYHLHEPTVSFHIREIGYTAIVFYRLTCSSQAHHHRLQLCRTTSVSRLPAAGTELAVKPKGRAAQARRRHYYTVQISIIIAPLRNRVILFHLFFPTVLVGQGSGRFLPSRGIGSAASVMQEQKPTTKLTTRRLSGRLPCGLARARALPSEPSEWEWESVPLTDSLQSTNIIHVRLFR